MPFKSIARHDPPCRRSYPRPPKLESVKYRIESSNFPLSSKLPGHGPVWMRIVRTEIAGLDPRSEVAAEHRDCLTDSGDGLFDSFGDRRARPLGVRPDPPLLSTES